MMVVGLVVAMIICEGEDILAVSRPANAGSRASVIGIVMVVVMGVQLDMLWAMAIDVRLLAKR